MINGCLDTPAAARYCAVSKALLEKLRCYGGGPVFCRLGLGRGRIVYLVLDLDIWLNERRRRSTSCRGGLGEAPGL